MNFAAFVNNLDSTVWEIMQAPKELVSTDSTRNSHTATVMHRTNLREVQIDYFPNAHQWQFEIFCQENAIEDYPCIYTKLEIGPQVQWLMESLART